MKKCSKCQTKKSFSEFHKNKASPDGYAFYCKPCKKEHAAKNYEKHKEHIQKKNKEWAENNKERKAATDSEWQRNNRDKRNAAFRRWKEKHRSLYLKRAKDYDSRNLAKKAARETKRRARKLQATPAWADLGKIEVFYLAAKAMDFFNPFYKHHVDHVIPLQNNKVCGLHVEDNLQILTASENQSKGNKFVWC